MIAIDTSGYAPDPKWLERAAQVAQQLEDAEDDDERKRIIDANQTLWTELKQDLLDLSAGKCWYSEARDVYSHPHVEHYRPSKEAKDLDGNKRTGYWWLAFDYTNYRICGSVGNVAKGSHFPLRDGSTCATPANRICEDEQPYILDPANIDDPILLSFDEDGRATPSEGISRWQEERVRYSIRRMRMDHEPLAEARRMIWQLCRRKIGKYTRLLSHLDEGGVKTREELASVLEELRQMVKPDSELSATAGECLRKSGVPIMLRVANGI